jgi:prolyl 4-hydroxylase
MLAIFIVVALLAFRGDSFFWGQKDTENDDYDAAMDPSDYGVDVSFPIHHYSSKRTGYSNPLKGYFMARYERHMKGCYDKFSFRECDANERARLEMSLEQPATQYNYTKIGFMKRRLPDDLFKMITTFWEANKGKEKLEQWPRGNTYTNNWVAPTYMVNLEDKEFTNGWLLKTKIWEGVRPIIEEWTGQKLTETSLYGIRVYKNNSILATHVDRLPLVSSCIIQVAQDIDEPWPVEVIGHDGKAHNVTMLPGDMVLYESHSILHGRPFPLNGNFYANIFVHYSPIGHDENNKHITELGPSKIGLVKEIIPRIPPARASGHEGDNHDPDTLDRHRSNHDADNHGQLRGQVTKQEDVLIESDVVEPLDGQTALHIAAQSGDFDEARRLLDGASPTLLHARDANNWQPIHEAARAGHLNILKFLVELGADVSARTINGGSPLFWAQQGGENSRAAVEYLESIGAPLYTEDNVEN